jgi:hypothetical protein
MEEEKYQPKTANEAQQIQLAEERGFSKGYHIGLREGYAVARFPERCHCNCCISHGEYCRH